MRECHQHPLMWQGLPASSEERFHPRAHATWSSALALIERAKPNRLRKGNVHCGKRGMISYSNISATRTSSMFFLAFINSLTQ